MSDNFGPAFPVGDQQNIIPEAGMTLRDYFAAAYITGTRSYSSTAELAKRAYELADAMLAEREG